MLNYLRITGHEICNSFKGREKKANGEKRLLNIGNLGEGGFRVHGNTHETFL